LNRNAENSPSMSAVESRAAISLAGIFSFRMLGLFLILPVFALYAQELADVTPIMVGLAIGAYGLTQALLQVPFGLLSDRIGRKPVIIAGLLIFALGSVVAANADSIWGVIFGRALQGSGAIAAAVMALLADLTREEHRTKAMAVVGMSIGLAFTVSLILGPLLNAWIGVPGIFWLTAMLALVGIAITLLVVPDPKGHQTHRDAGTALGQVGKVLRMPELLRLDLGISVLHMILTALFLVVPLALRDEVGLVAADHWKVYLPVMLASLAVMVPFVVIAEKRRQMKRVFVGAIATLVFALVAFALWGDTLWGIVIALWIFFVAFNLLEATLPSLISKVAPAASKGTAMGVYSTSQFFGAFIGGVVGGWVQSHYGMPGVFWFSALAALLWWGVAWGMAPPNYLSSKLLRVGVMDAAQASELELQLSQIKGVGEVGVVAEEGVAYLKVDLQQIDLALLDEFSSEAI